MSETTGQNSSTGEAPRGVRRRRRSASRVKNYALIAAIVVVFTLGIVLAGGGRDVLRRLYADYVILVVVLMTIEYIVLKGRDRSRIYKIERDQTRARRRDDLEFLRQVDEDLVRIEGELKDAMVGEAPPDEERVRQLANELDAVHRRIAQRV